MADRLLIGNYSQGQRTDREAFIISNDSFPTLENAFVWRGKVLKKGGTQTLGRLQRDFDGDSAITLSTQASGTSYSISSIFADPNVNIDTSQPNASLVPNTLAVTVGSQFFFDNGAGTFSIGKAITGVSVANPAQVTSNGHGLSTGNVVFITGIVGLSGIPSLNDRSYTITVTGVNTFTLNGVNTSTASTPYSSGGGFITTTPVAATSGSINYSTSAMTLAFSPALGGATNVVIFFSYYPRLPVLGLEDIETNAIEYPILLAFDQRYSYQFDQQTKLFYSTSFYKNSHLPIFWTGQDYQQFWSTNYQGALWAVNNNPNIDNATGAIWHFKLMTGVTAVNATRLTVVIPSHGIPSTVTANTVYLWFNEVTGTLGGALPPTNYNISTNINGKTGSVFAVVDANTLTVDFVGTNFPPAATGSGGMAQYLTISNPQANVDGIRWYDGGEVPDPTKGWVNFAPPLSNFDPSTNPNPLYLIGALAVIPFKDRLVFFAPTFGQSNGVNNYYQDRIVFSWNGTPYYSSLTPVKQTSSPEAWFFPPSGQAGFIGAGLAQQIVSVTNNEDVLLVGFEKRQTRLVYTGNDLTPFLFYSINSEMGSEGTFSGVTLDAGGISVGTYGIIKTSQSGVERIDLQIPDNVFQITGLNHGVERICSVRDYYNEIIYFTYPIEGENAGNDDDINPTFPNQSLVYNYRDGTWAVFIENYTTYGSFRYNEGLTWDEVIWTWDEWLDPWSFGQAAPRFPNVIGGNQQGYVMVKQTSRSQAGEDISGYVTNIVGNVVTSPNHTLATGDYLYFTGAIGSVGINFTTRRITVTNINTFNMDGDPVTGTYLGGGEFTRLSNFRIITKQFPAYWEQGRQVRIGGQKYLFDRTNLGELTVLLSLSQDMSNFDNPLDNGSVIYNNLIYTRPDPGSITLPGQQQIWHNYQTSLIGDTVQIGFTLSDAQMRALSSTEQPSPTVSQAPVTLQAIQFDLYPAGVLAQ